MAEMEQAMRIAEQGLEGIPGGSIQVDWEGRAIDPDIYVDLGKQGKTEGLLLIPITLSPNLQGQDRGAHRRVDVSDKRVVLPPKEAAYGSIEGLMNHFMLVMDGYGVRPPPGEAYFPWRVPMASSASTWCPTARTGPIGCAAGRRACPRWPRCRG
jgi:hypothetical protein